MKSQRTLRFTLYRKNGQLAVNNKADESILNHPRNLETPKKTVTHCPKDIAQIKNMVCTLAGLISKNPEALELFQRQFDTAQIEEVA